MRQRENRPPPAGLVAVSQKRCDFFAAQKNKQEVSFMETRVALVGIIVENEASVAKLNELLHRYGSYIIGRMGLPYREKGVNIISVVLDAPQDIISALSGQIGRLDGVSSKTQYSHIITPSEE